jgi:hypothetical protein
MAALSGAQAPKDRDGHIGQLVGRYDAKKMWARDRWHLTSRWLRKVLSHTMAVHLCQRAGLSPLRFSDLLTD